MKKNARLYKSIILAIIALLIFQMTACGTLLYPQRRGQKTGRIDTGVAILDGLGLIFFIVPGVVAFVVDFSSGAIFLPPGVKTTPLFSSENMQLVHVDLKNLNRETIEKAIAEHTGHIVSLNREDVIVSKIKRPLSFLSDYKRFVESGNMDIKK